jgi:hypothetical protein
MSSTSLKKRSSLTGSGNAVPRAPPTVGLVASALGLEGSVPDEVARKVKGKRLSLFFLQLDSPMLFSLSLFFFLSSILTRLSPENG